MIKEWRIKVIQDMYLEVNNLCIALFALYILALSSTGLGNSSLCLGWQDVLYAEH